MAYRKVRVEDQGEGHEIVRELNKHGPSSAERYPKRIRRTGSVLDQVMASMIDYYFVKGLGGAARKYCFTRQEDFLTELSISKRSCYC